VKTVQVKYNGMGGGRILCCYKYVAVVLTCVCGFLCILGSVSLLLCVYWGVHWSVTMHVYGIWRLALALCVLLRREK